MKKVEAIILDKTSLGESDEIIVAFTKEMGKVRFRARGVKKPMAKHTGNLPHLNWLDLFFVEGNGFPIITDTFLKDSFPRTKKDYDKLLMINKVTKVLVHFLPDEMPDLVTWWLLSDYFKSLEELEIRKEVLALSPVFFIFKLLSLHGFQPELNRCIGCRREIKSSNWQKEKFYFSALTGGVLGDECLYLDQNAHLISYTTVAFLKEWPTQDTKSFLSKKYSPKIKKEIEKSVNSFTDWHLGKSTELFNKV